MCVCMCEGVVCMCVHVHMSMYACVCVGVCIPAFNSDYVHESASGVSYLLKRNLTVMGCIAEKYDIPPLVTTNCFLLLRQGCGLIGSAPLQDRMFITLDLYKSCLDSHC